MFRRCFAALPVIALMAAVTMFAVFRNAMALDRSTETILNLSGLNDDQLGQIAAGRTLIVYVGNAEARGVVEFLAPLDPARRKAILDDIQHHQDRLHRVVLDGVGQFREALRKNEFTYRPGMNQGEICLLAIVDGPGVGDSQISTFRYQWSGGKWMETQVEHWRWSESLNLERVEEGTRFELNLPASITRIVRQMLRLGPRGFVDSTHFDRALYFVRSHGGRFTLDPSIQPTLLNQRTASDLRHVLLYDAHGANGESLRSNLYAAYWSKETAKTVLETAVTLEDGSSFENTGTSFENTGTSFENSGNSFENTGTSFENTGTSFENTGTSFENTGTSFSDGSSFENGSSFSDGSSFQDGSTFEAGGTFGFGGKKMIYDCDIVPIPGRSGKKSTSPEWIVRLGAACTYGKGQLPQGVVPLELPHAESPRAPTLVMLESCHGDHIVAESVPGDSAKVVSIISPGQLYVDLVHYDRFSASRLQALPFILSWGLDEQSEYYTPIVGEIAQHLVSHVSGDGLLPEDGFRFEGKWRENWCKLSVRVRDSR